VIFFVEVERLERSCEALQQASQRSARGQPRGAQIVR
jgi:hypothetical protein